MAALQLHARLMARKLPPPSDRRVADQILDIPETSVLDVLDHILTKGVTATGDVTLGVAGVELIYVRLSALLCAADRVLPPGRREQQRQRRLQQFSSRARRAQTKK
jgi:hypothetical protein